MADPYSQNPINPVLDPQTRVAVPPGGIPIQQASPGDSGHVSGPASALTGLFLLGAGEPSKARRKASEGKVGGAGDPPNLNPDILIRSELQRQYPGAPITDQMVQYIKAQLSSKGLNENSKAADYRSGIDQYIQSNPNAQSYFSQYSPFGQAPQAGQLSPAALSQMLQITKQFQQPYLDQLGAVSDQMGKELAQIIPGLPGAFKSLIGAEQPIYANLGKQLGAAIGASDPGLIAQAYAKYYQPATAAAPSLGALQALTHST